MNSPAHRIMVRVGNEQPRSVFYLVGIGILISTYFQQVSTSSTIKVKGNMSSIQKNNFGFHSNYTAVYFDPVDFMEYNGLQQTLDRSGLTELLKTIHTRFDEIMVPFHVPPRRFASFSNYDVPEATALYNQLKNGSSSRSSVLKLIILFKVTNWKDQAALLSAFKLGQNAKNNANYIFPGTVKSVILEISEEEQVYNHYSQFRELFSQFGRKHKFGIQLDIKYCSGISSPTSQFLLGLRNDILSDFSLDVAYFSDNVTSHMSGVSVDRSMEMSLNRFDACKKLVGSLHRRVKLGLIATWPDTDVNGRVNHTEMVDFWRKMDKWAGEFKTPVILLQAFDTPLASERILKTNGWWRLLPSSSYLNSSQFIFEEKASKIKNDKDPSVNLTRLAQETEFSRDMVGVHFNPFPLPVAVGKADESTLLPLVEQISTQFSKILLTTESLKHDMYLSPVGIRQMTLSVPGALSRWNFNINRKSLKLIMTFDRTTANEVAKLTHEANQITPATITQLIYCPSSFDEGTLLDGFAEIAKFPEIYGRIVLGIKMSMEVCKNWAQLLGAMNHLSFYFTANFKIKVIYISATVPLADTILGAERVIPLLLVSFENCRKMIWDYLANSKDDKIEVALITGWPIKGEDDSLEGMIKHIQFWEHVNDWAAKGNVTVIMNSSFDPPSVEGFREKPALRYGWWTVTKDEALGSNGHFRFEDMKNAAYRLATKSTSAEDDSSYLSSSMVIPSATFFMVFVIVSCLTVWYLRKGEYLTKEEIEQFLNGGGSKGSSENLKGLNGPYQKGNFELSKTSFSIEESSSLGSGAFGKVCMGKVTKGDGVQDVAVKMTKVPCPRSALRALLFEIQILAYLGKHPHIVELVGASTSQLRKGKVFIFLELCLLGSLQDYLRKWKEVAAKTDDGIHPETGNELSLLPDHSLASDMPRWSYEVASGMEFIASKHVVHLDIASRNVLLTGEKTVKITDFGLSRRMYNYQSYKKEEQEPLPWRWMAPESLRRSEFTEKSDVWGFGVLLWEIYSLGDEPYPGLAWEVNFPNKLERGLRLCEPIYNSSSMYSVMLRCWSTNPEGRPTFSEIVQMLRSYAAVTTPADQLEDFSQTCTNTNQQASDHRNTAAGNMNNIDHIQIPSKLALAKEWSNVCYAWSLLSALLLLLLMIATISILYLRSSLDTRGTTQLMDKDNSSFLPERNINISTNSSLPKLVGTDESAESTRFEGVKLISPANESVTGSVSDPVATGSEKEHVSPTKGYQYDQKQQALNKKLFMAIEGGKEAAVTALVKLGASVNSTNSQGQTPLLRSSRCDTDKISCLKIIQYLVDNGADVFVKDGNGGTFLHNLLGGSHASGPTLTPSQFHDIVTFLISKNLTRLLNTPGYSQHTPLTWAVKTIEIQTQTLAILHQAGANFHAVNDWGNSILADALFGFRSTEFLANLIALGVDWRHLNNDNFTLLHFASWFGHVDGTKYFLKLGLGASDRTIGGDSPLHLVARYGQLNILETARLLIEAGASLSMKNDNSGGRTPLLEAIRNTNMKDDVRNNLIQLIRDAESDRSWDQPLFSGKDPASLGKELFNLVDRLNEDAIKILVELGADINVRNELLETPLIKTASYRGDEPTRSCLRIIKYLIKNGADVYAKDHEGLTFLHVLLTADTTVTPAQFHKMALFLVKRNMTSLFMSQGGPSGNTVLFSAVRFMTVEVATLTLLHESGVNFDVVNYNGDSVLLHAFKWKRNMKLLTDFVKLGANWRYLNYRNQSLLHGAAEECHVPGVKYFLGRGLDVNWQDVEGLTPLHLSTLYGRSQNLLEIVRILVGGGADVKIMDNYGRRALTFVKARKNIADRDELIKLLEDSEEEANI